MIKSEEARTIEKKVSFEFCKTLVGLHKALKKEGWDAIELNTDGIGVDWAKDLAEKNRQLPSSISLALVLLDPAENRRLCFDTAEESVCSMAIQTFMRNEFYEFMEKNEGKINTSKLLKWTNDTILKVAERWYFRGAENMLSSIDIMPTILAYFG